MKGIRRRESKRTRTAALGVCLLLVSGCGYNTIVELHERVDAAWAQVENQLQRRNDLIPNLVETAKGYAAHEKAVFENIAQARSRLAGAASREEKIDAANEVGAALARLLMIVERYPELKANEQFSRLMDELAGTENRIATERRRYNEAVREYNTYIKKLPQRLVAEVAGFEEEKYFEAPTETRQPPEVRF